MCSREGTWERSTNRILWSTEPNQIVFTDPPITTCGLSIGIQALTTINQHNKICLLAHGFTSKLRKVFFLATVSIESNQLVQKFGIKS